jgi:hypothetical protein
MAITVVIDPELDSVLSKIAESGVQHPVARSRTFVDCPVIFEFSMGPTGTTATLRLSESETHLWPFAAEITKTFDDRSLA